jgi:hypothetical protein
MGLLLLFGGGIWWAIVAALNLIAIFDVIDKYKDLGTRFVLIVMILLVPIIGAGFYLLVLRPKNSD